MPMPNRANPPARATATISEVERKDIAKLHFDLCDKPYQAHRTLCVLTKMLSLAEIWGPRPDGSNPRRHVKHYKERKRVRFLSPEETERLSEVLRDAENEMPSAVAAFRLLLLTGCRLSEIQFLRWEYVKDDCIELPDAKTGGRIVPLGPEARAVLADLPREEGNPWVIRGRLPGSHITDLQKPWVGFRISLFRCLLGVHFAFRPAWSLNCPRQSFDTECFNPCRCLHEPPGCY